MSLRAAQANEVARLKQVLQAEQAGFSLEQEAVRGGVLHEKPGNPGMSVHTHVGRR